MKGFRLLDTKSKEYCFLREYFETLDKGSIEKTIRDLNIISDRKIDDLEKLPEFTPYLDVFNVRQLDEKECYVLNERIYTNDPFLKRFRSFLRASAEEVEAEGFEDVPKGYEAWYKTPYTLVPVDIQEAGVVLHEPGKIPKLLNHKRVFRGVDYERRSTLRMVKAKTIEERLKEIEKVSDFSAMIVYTGPDYEKKFEEELEAFEVKQGKIHFAVTKI